MKVVENKKIAVNTLTGEKEQHSGESTQWAAPGGGCREGVQASTLFQVKKKEIREGRKAGRSS